MNQFRCETCKYKHPHLIGGCKPDCEKSSWLLTNETIEVIEEVGCASHSDFQSGREKLLDEMRIKYVVFLNHPCPELADKYKHCCDAEWCGLCTLDEVLEELRQAGKP